MRSHRLLVALLAAAFAVALSPACRHGGATGEKEEVWGFLDGGAPTVQDADGGTHVLGDCRPTPGAPGNSLFVGQFCTLHGEQCVKNPRGTANACAIDLDSRGGGYCIRVFCGKNSECGEGACCTGDPGGWAKACVPIGCVTDAGVCPSP